jgi:tetratricopeptide (TPR) repeat protein
MNQQEQAERHFQTGKTLRERNLFFAAAKELQKAVELAPNRADLLLEWGRTLSDQDDLDGAIGKFRQASEMDPTRADAYVLWGDALRVQERHVEAVTQYARAVQLDPHNMDAHTGWAETLYAQEKWTEALAEYAQVVQGDPGRDIYFNFVAAMEHLGFDERTKAVDQLTAQLAGKAAYATALTQWANALAAMEKYVEATELFRKVSLADPAFAPAYAGWGDALQQQGKYAQALQLYLRVIDRYPDEFWLSYNVKAALIHLDEHDPAAITDALRDVPMSDAHRAVVYSWWGDTLAGGARYPKAIKRYQEALRLSPDSLVALLGWGDALVGQGKYQEAIEPYRMATQAEPQSGLGYRKWAVALSLLERSTDAARCYEQAIEKDVMTLDFSELLRLLATLDPERAAQTLAVLDHALEASASPERYDAWGSALFRDGQYRAATAQYAEALRLNAKAVAVWDHLGQAQAGLRDYENAVTSFRKITELDPYDASAYIQWGLALVYQRRYAEAVECYEKVQEFDPDNQFVHANWGWTLYRQQRYDEAIGQYRQAIENDGYFAMAYHYWGMALAAQRRYGEAITQYQKALDLEPANPIPRLDLGNALYEQGRHAEAIDVCTKATEINPDLAYPYHNIAYYLWAQGDYTAGRRAWEQACGVYQRTSLQEKKRGNVDFFQYYGAVLHEQLWNLEEAEQVLQLGLAIDPDHTGILGNLLRLYLDRHEEACAGTQTRTEGPSIYWKAQDCYRKAERILLERLAQFEDSWTLQELGDLYLKMERYEQAQGFLQAALKKDSLSPTSYISLGVVCSRRENYRQSVRYFEEAHRRTRDDLNVWSNLAEAYLKLNPKSLQQIEKSEAEFQKILKIAPDHIDSQIGLGEVYTAMAESGEKDFYEAAIKHFDAAIQLAESGRGSKHLKARELAAVRYSLGYARVKFYEASRPFGDETLLADALQDFQRCFALDPDHHKAERAKGKLDKRLSRFSRRWLAERVAPWLVLAPSLFVLLVTQLTFIFGVPELREPLKVASYITLTFGSLIFVVVGLFLPEIQKLKGAGIELEKGAVTQISPSGSLGISK